jgi:fumarylacetoacetase
LLPNYKGCRSAITAARPRFASASLASVTSSGACGQTVAAGATVPSFGPTQRLDYELELGVFVSRPNAMGEPIGMESAEAHVFGFALFNGLDGPRRAVLGISTARPF